MLDLVSHSTYEIMIYLLLGKYSFLSGDQSEPVLCQWLMAMSFMRGFITFSHTVRSCVIISSPSITVNVTHARGKELLPLADCTT